MPGGAAPGECGLGGGVSGGATGTRWLRLLAGHGWLAGAPACQPHAAPACCRPPRIAPAATHHPPLNHPHSTSTLGAAPTDSQPGDDGGGGGHAGAALRGPEDGHPAGRRALRAGCGPDLRQLQHHRRVRPAPRPPPPPACSPSSCVFVLVQRRDADQPHASPPVPPLHPTPRLAQTPHPPPHPPRPPACLPPRSYAARHGVASYGDLVTLLFRRRGARLLQVAIAVQVSGVMIGCEPPLHCRGVVRGPARAEQPGPLTAWRVTRHDWMRVQLAAGAMEGCAWGLPRRCAEGTRVRPAQLSPQRRLTPPSRTSPPPTQTA